MFDNLCTNPVFLTSKLIDAILQSIQGSNCRKIHIFQFLYFLRLCTNMGNQQIRNPENQLLQKEKQVSVQADSFDPLITIVLYIIS